MAGIRNDLVCSAINRAYAIIDINIHNNLNKRKSFTKDKKSKAIKLLTIKYDYNKILYNGGIKRICELYSKLLKSKFFKSDIWK